MLKVHDAALFSAQTTDSILIMVTYKPILIGITPVNGLYRIRLKL